MRVKNWIELQRELFATAWNKQIRRFRSDHAFRGMNTAGSELETTLARLGGNYRELEGHLLRNFRKYAHHDAAGEDSVWAWLALAQHHGLPTRLLDWTYSPYVALHFATDDLESFHLDGVVWMVNYVALHERVPARLRNVLRRERSNTFTIEMLQETTPSLTRLERLSKRPFALFVEPPSLDARIVNQYALFSMMSTAEARLDTHLERLGSDVARRVVIPAALKWEVRDKLDQANITERVLFPGLDGLSRWLKRHYLPMK